jgi:hypothetical protein
MTNGDLPDFAEGLNRFYQEHNLWKPMTPATLQSFLDQTVVEIRPNQLYGVLRGDRVVGGLSVSDRTNLVRMKVTNTPGYVRLLGAVLGILPKSGLLNALSIRHVWFGTGELEAGRYLWEFLRYSLRDQGNCLGVAYDPRGPLADVFQVPFWLPLVKATYGVRSNIPVESNRLTYCIAGP